VVYFKCFVRVLRKTKRTLVTILCFMAEALTRVIPVSLDGSDTAGCTLRCSVRSLAHN
jgi:hypothetical protein